jgi:hypothetical protein
LRRCGISRAKISLVDNFPFWICSSSNHDQCLRERLDYDDH